jgi:hypothetical protein
MAGMMQSKVDSVVIIESNIMHSGVQQPPAEGNGGKVLQVQPEIGFRRGKGWRRDEEPSNAAVMKNLAQSLRTLLAQKEFIQGKS